MLGLSPFTRLVKRSILLRKINFMKTLRTNNMHLKNQIHISQIKIFREETFCFRSITTEAELYSLIENIQQISLYYREPNPYCEGWYDLLATQDRIQNILFSHIKRFITFIHPLLLKQLNNNNNQSSIYLTLYMHIVGTTAT